MTIKVTGCVVVVALALLIGPGAVGQQSPNAGTSSLARTSGVVDMGAEQYNMCSASCGDHVGASNLVSWFNTTKPLSTSLNEVCYGDPIAFAYPNYFVPTKLREARCYGGNDYGIVISAPDPISTLRYYYAHQHGTSNGCVPTTSFECRAMGCITSNVFGFLYETCTTHLLNSDTSTAQAEANEYAFVSTAYSPGATILSGDFNLDPPSIPPVYGTNFFQTQIYYTFNAKQGLYELIDYIFPSQNRTASYYYIGPYCGGSPPPSDHCFAFANFGMTY